MRYATERYDFDREWRSFEGRNRFGQRRFRTRPETCVAARSAASGEAFLIRFCLKSPLRTSIRQRWEDGSRKGLLLFTLVFRLLARFPNTHIATADAKHILAIA